MDLWQFKKNNVLSVEEVLIKRIEIRDSLVECCEFISSKPLITIKDYEELDIELNTILKKVNINSSTLWVHKYFHLMFSDKFSTFYTEHYQIYALNKRGIIPSSKTYGCWGQIVLIAKSANLELAFL